MLYFVVLVSVVSLLLSGRKSYAADRINVGYIDIKGEKGVLGLPKKNAIAVATLATWLAGHSYAGFDAVYTEVMEIPLQGSATEPSGVVGLGNDKDLKMTMGFKGAEGNFKISLPCPKINVEGGFVIRWGDERAFLPPVKATGELGDDGNTVCASLISAGTIPQGSTFQYGRLVKKG
jgi:hypothetical protein